jgi:hypothetical protein
MWTLPHDWSVWLLTFFYGAAIGVTTTAVVVKYWVDMVRGEVVWLRLRLREEVELVFHHVERECELEEVIRVGRLEERRPLGVHLDGDAAGPGRRGGDGRRAAVCEGAARPG